MSAVLPLTRAIFVTGALLTAGTGATLYSLPARTEDYWAWTIAAEPSASFLGAGYLGAAVALVLAARERAWERTRLIAVLALTLTSLTLLVTLLNLDPFDFGGGIAWVWVAVYVALPPLVLTAFVRQERAGGRREYGGRWARTPTRLVAAGVGTALGAYGAALLANWDAATSSWPWPLTQLTAGILGGWLVTYAVGLLWFALRERSWRRSRTGAIALAVTALLDLAAAARWWDDLDGGASPVAYVCVLAVLLAAVGLAARVEAPRTDPGLEAIQ